MSEQLVKLKSVKRGSGSQETRPPQEDPLSSASSIEQPFISLLKSKKQAQMSSKTSGASCKRKLQAAENMQDQEKQQASNQEISVDKDGAKVEGQVPAVNKSQQAKQQARNQSSKKAPKPRRRVATIAQRRAANIRERRRMYNLNSAFDRLRKKVPSFAYEKRLSRIETLKLAIMYIKFMGDLVSDESYVEKYKQLTATSSSHHHHLHHHNLVPDTHLPASYPQLALNAPNSQSAPMVAKQIPASQSFYPPAHSSKSPAPRHSMNDAKQADFNQHQQPRMSRESSQIHQQNSGLFSDFSGRCDARGFILDSRQLNGSQNMSSPYRFSQSICNTQQFCGEASPLNNTNSIPCCSSSSPSASLSMRSANCHSTGSTCTTLETSSNSSPIQAELKTNHPTPGHPNLSSNISPNLIGHLHQSEHMSYQQEMHPIYEPNLTDQRYVMSEKQRVLTKSGFCYTSSLQSDCNPPNTDLHLMQPNTRHQPTYYDQEAAGQPATVGPNQLNSSYSLQSLQAR